MSGMIKIRIVIIGKISPHYNTNASSAINYLINSKDLSCQFPENFPDCKPVSHVHVHDCVSLIVA